MGVFQPGGCSTKLRPPVDLRAFMGNVWLSSEQRADWLSEDYKRYIWGKIHLSYEIVKLNDGLNELCIVE